MAKKTAKTNAMRILDRAGISYQTYTYESEDGVIDGISVAEKLNQPLSQVFKTLVTVGHSGEYHVFVIPVAAELDLKAAAKAVGEKSVEMIPVKEINRVTGYIRGGCSPIGMKKQYATCVDKSCLNQDTIIFSGGKIGFQIEMKPQELLELVAGTTSDITVR
ncbi:Cys-tRNA(Pro) deacylase [Massiliimalia massiliensis]|uniref:Cys-tRNA(Pro) deacylase n=1 Tax=Massiliimalia massiliensis TaxID=1852384 RepID=UPI00098438B7|nr:Cys-tRNA(Pro) deacylase [Massiliimalia massiliensis]